MGLAETVFGTPPSQNWIKSGGSQASPGYGFAKSFYDFLPSLMQQAYPTYQGQLDGGLSPTLQDAIRRAQGYSQSSPAEILQGVQGTLSGFMQPNFLNPWNAMTTQPNNYGGRDMNTRAYGGQPIGSYGGFAGSNPGGQMGGVPPLGGGQGGARPPAGDYGFGRFNGLGGQGGGQGFVAGEPAPGSMPGGMSSMTRGGMPGGGGAAIPPPLGQSAPGQAPGGAGSFGSALNMNFNDAQGALSRMFQGNAQGLNSALGQQYGMNQYGQQNDGRDQFMHSTDHLSALQRTLGREPTFDEVQQSLRSGPGAIEQARSLFQQDDPNGRAGWGAGQSAYGNLVDQYGLAKGGQMFQQQFGNGPMWAGGAPGGSPSSVPPLGGPPSGPIVDPSQLPGAGGAVGASRPGAATPTPATGIPPLGTSGGGSAPTMPGAVDPMNGPAPGPGIKPLGSTPITSVPPRPVVIPKPITGNVPRQVNPRPATPGRPGSTDQNRGGGLTPGAWPTGGKPPTELGPLNPTFTPKPDGGTPGQVFNPKTGNWHTPGAGKKRLNLATSP